MKSQKNIILTICFLFEIFMSTAQVLKPSFEFTLYAEDSRGNKDSIIIGYHPDATGPDYGKIDPQFGDLHVVRKFDSVFEIRGHKMSYVHNRSWRSYNSNEQNLVLARNIQDKGISKRITLRYTNRSLPSCTPGGISGNGFILVKIKYPPVKFYWDKKNFDRTNAPCVGKSYIVPSEIYRHESPPEDPIWNGASVYLSNQESFKSNIVDIPHGPYRPALYQIPYLDGTNDSLYNFVFVFENSQARITNIDENVEKISQSFPNPCRDFLNIQLQNEEPFNAQINIYGLEGSLIKSEKKRIDNAVLQIRTEELTRSMYFLEIIAPDGKRFSGKFLKE